MSLGTLRRECLDHLIVLDEQHLASVLHECVAYYNRERPHRTLGLQTPEPRRRPNKLLAAAPIAVDGLDGCLDHASGVDGLRTHGSNQPAESCRAPAQWLGNSVPRAEASSGHKRIVATSIPYSPPLGSQTDTLERAEQKHARSTPRFPRLLRGSAISRRRC
jgi:hypothetical protein